MNNPFNTAFGREPASLIARENELTPIVESFQGRGIPTDAYVITGPRGSGKTVALASLLRRFGQMDGFLPILLTISDHMLEQMASKIYESGGVRKLFSVSEFSFSFQGFSLSIKGDKPVASVEVLLEKMLAHLKKKGITVVLGIDDVGISKELQSFVRSFQGFAMEGYDIKIVLTGLYEYIRKLETGDSLTFLARARKIFLSPLSLPLVTLSYSRVFDIPNEKAAELAKLTKGYAFAYQALGSILFRDNKKEVDNDVIMEFDSLLFSCSYEIIWAELTKMERNILFMVANGKTSNLELKEALGVSDSYISIYKKKLIEKSILLPSNRGESVFSLPRFGEFILLQSLFEE